MKNHFIHYNDIFAILWKYLWKFEHCIFDLDLNQRIWSPSYVIELSDNLGMSHEYLNLHSWFNFIFCNPSVKVWKGIYLWFCVGSLYKTMIKMKFIQNHLDLNNVFPYKNKNYYVVRNAGLARSRNTWRLTPILFNQWSNQSINYY